MIISKESSFGNVYYILEGYVPNRKPFVQVFQKPDGDETIAFNLLVDTKLPSSITADFKGAQTYETLSISCYYYINQSDGERKLKNAKLLKSLSGYDRVFAWGKLSASSQSKRGTYLSVTLSGFILPDRLNALLITDDLEDNSEVSELKGESRKKKFEYTKRTTYTDKRAKPRKTKTKTTEEEWFD